MIAQNLLHVAIGVIGVIGVSGGALAQDAILGPIEVRSTLGQPLKLRVPVVATNVSELQPNCFSVVRNTVTESVNAASDLQVTLVETRAARYLQLAGESPYNEPVARVTLRVACPGSAIFDREYSVLLDLPPTRESVPVAIGGDESPATAAPVSAVSEDKPAGTAPTWIAREGDSLQSLASAVYPKNAARQQQYIANLRVLNPALASTPVKAPLPAGTLLRMPDLHQLSGIAPSARGVVPEQRAARTGARSTSRSSASPRMDAAVPASPVPAPVAATTPTQPRPAPPSRTARSSRPPKEAAIGSQAPAAAAAGFGLRLSGAEMDTTRSARVTEEQRRELRGKQLILDTDDQVSALLSLQNTVKQLETRLNELQLKMSTTTRAGQAGEAAPAIPAPVFTGTQPGASSSVPVAGSAPAPSIAKAEPVLPAKPAQPASVDTSSKPQPTATEPPAANPSTGWIGALPAPFSSPAAAAALGAGLLALLAALVWTRRRRRDSPLHSALKRADKIREQHLRDNARLKDTSHAGGDTSQADADFFEQPAADAARGNAATKASSARALSPTLAGQVPAWLANSTSTFDVTADFDSREAREAAAAHFELDSAPGTTVDLMLGTEERGGEGRVRRLQYMQQRYPELLSNTVSIDEGDSVVNAARLYYEEGQTAKACELLTFAVEERPQDIRFWLAQFEIFRIENMVAEFAALAAKFHVLFGGTPAWPKVRHVGHEIDPANPLFAAAGRDPLATETRFDPVAENWLNAPMDFTSEALMSDLRRALFDDYAVDRPDFESITARLAAGVRTG